MVATPNDFDPFLFELPKTKTASQFETQKKLVEHFMKNEGGREYLSNHLGEINAILNQHRKDLEVKSKKRGGFGLGRLRTQAKDAMEALKKLDEISKALSLLQNKNTHRVSFTPLSDVSTHGTTSVASVRTFQVPNEITKVMNEIKPLIAKNQSPWCAAFKNDYEEFSKSLSQLHDKAENKEEYNKILSMFSVNLDKAVLSLNNEVSKYQSNNRKLSSKDRGQLNALASLQGKLGALKGQVESHIVEAPASSRFKELGFTFVDADALTSKPWYRRLYIPLKSWL